MTLDEVLKMSRPKKKQVIEFFPHYVNSDSKTRYILETNWGNDGYAFWFKMLELLGRSEGHYYDCSTAVNKAYLVALTSVKEETADDILNTLAMQGKIDKELWENNKIIWCQSFVDNLQELYSRRSCGTPRKPGSPEEPEEKPIEPLKEESIETPVKKRKTRPRKNRTLPLKQQKLFDEFYENYPKHVDPARAEVAWGKIDPEPDEEFLKKILQAVEDAKKYDSRFQEYRFIPNPASWLNAKGYLSEYGRGGSGHDVYQTGTWDGGAFEPSGGFRR